MGLSIISLVVVVGDIEKFPFDMILIFWELISVKVTRGEAEDGVIRRNGKTCSDSIIFSGTPRLHTLTKFVESPKYSVISPT